MAENKPRSPMRLVVLLFVAMAFWMLYKQAGSKDPSLGGEIWVDVAAAQGGNGSKDKPLAALPNLSKGLKPGSVLHIRAGKPLEGDLVLRKLNGTAEKPIVIRGEGEGRAKVLGRAKLVECKHVVLERLAFEPKVADTKDLAAWVDVKGDGVELRDCSVRSAPAAGVMMTGKDNAIRGGEIAACNGEAVAGYTENLTIDGVRIESCGRGVRACQPTILLNCLLLHNRGPAVDGSDSADTATRGPSLRCYNNLFYDNAGGVFGASEIVNNIFVNNYASTLLGEHDVEVSVGAGAKVDHNVYFRHPGKDKLLRGLPYGQVDLSPLRADNPFGLRLRVDGKVVFSLKDPAWTKFDQHSQSLDIIQRFTGPNSYTRSYEDLFADFQKEDFRPRYTSPAVGAGASIATVTKDIEGKPRLANHPDVGPYAAPAEWWKDIDSGKAIVVDGTVPLDAQGRDLGVGTAAKPYSTLAKAVAFARWDSRIYVKDAIYRHAAIQTSFSLGTDAVLSGFPGQRPAFTPSELIESARWEKYELPGARPTTQPTAGLYRIRDWHTFIGSNFRHNAWMMDWYGNQHIGGKDENVSSLARDRGETGQKVAQPFRPVRYSTCDRDTQQLLWDGIALQPAGGVVGLEDFPIGTCATWGRNPENLRPGSFMIGRRQFLLSKVVGAGRPANSPSESMAGKLVEGQYYLEGPNKHPEQWIRVNDKPAGYVSRFLAATPTTWQAVHTYPTGDKLWQLDAATVAKLGAGENRTLSGWTKVRADKDSAWWVRPFALPTVSLRLEGAPELTRREPIMDRNALPVNGWRQRQNQWSDPELHAVFENPYQDCLEVRLPANVDPNAKGLTASFFNARVEGLFRSTINGSGPGVNKAGAIMLSSFRVMEPCPTPQATAQTARENWQFGFLVPMGQTSPTLQVRMPAGVDPNAEDFWRLVVVDDCAYVFPPLGETPDRHTVDIACGAGQYIYAGGGNSSFMDWHDAGSLKDLPAAKVFSTELDFDHDEHDPLWLDGHPAIATSGLVIDTADASGKTIRLQRDVRLDLPAPGEKLLTVTYFEAAAAGVKKEHTVSSKQIGPDRRIVLPGKPAAFPDRFALMIAPASNPQARVEQNPWQALRTVATRDQLAPGTCFYDKAAHRFYVCPTSGTLPYAAVWSGSRIGPMAAFRGMYILGGNSYGHQKQYGWGSGLSVPSRLIEDVSLGFSTTGMLWAPPGAEVRDCLFRWSQCQIGRGGEVSGDVRHTADRIRKPELRVKHCVLDLSNTFLLDGNDNPTKNIPFGNHHIWEDNYFMNIMGGQQGCWWDQYCFNNVVQNNIFTGMGGVDVECCENLIVRNNIFAAEKRSAVTYRGSDRGYALSNTAFRGGGIWFDSEPQRANANEQGVPTYGENFPLLKRGPVPWMTIDNLGNEKGISLNVKWLPADGQPEVYYCENWDFATPLLIDGAGFKDYSEVGSVAAMKRGTYFHDKGARRLYVRAPDGHAFQSAAMTSPTLPQSDAVRRDLIYTMTCTRAGRLSIPYRTLAAGEFEITEPVIPGQSLQAIYFDDKGVRKVETFPVTAESAAAGLPRIKLAGKPADDRLFIGLSTELPPMVRITGAQGPNPRPGLLNDVKPFEAELIPGSTITASPLMGLKFMLFRGHFDPVKLGDQFESVFHSRSVYHFSALGNLWMDMRSWDPGDRAGHPCHGIDYMINCEQTDAGQSQLDYNCFWKDLHAVPGPLSASVRWDKLLFWNASGHPEGATLAEFTKATGYEQHSIAPPAYFTLVANPLRFDFRPLPDSPLLKAGVASKQQVGEFLFDPDAGNANQRFTYKGNERDMAGDVRGERPTIGAIENPCPGARAWYMAPDGTDADGRGATDAPLATAAFALARMRPGDVLVLKAGTYKQQIVIDRSGTSRDFLAIVAENPPYGTPKKFPNSGPSIIDASGLGDKPAILLKGCGHVRVAGIKVVGSKAKAAVELADTRDCVLEYVFVEKPTQIGISSSGRGNTVYECSVSGGMNGYYLSGSLADFRWCSAEEYKDTGLRGESVVGAYLLQNRFKGGSESQFGCFVGNSSHVSFDGNWAEKCRLAGISLVSQQCSMANNTVVQCGIGMGVVKGQDYKLLNNTLIECGMGIHCTLSATVEAYNNIIQADISPFISCEQLSCMFDYNVYSNARRPIRPLASWEPNAPVSLSSWVESTGCDRNSTVAPLMCLRVKDPNGRMRLRAWAVSVSNMTPHFNIGPDSFVGAPYDKGGTFVLDIPENWKPAAAGQGLYEFSATPSPGAAAAYCYWYQAKIDYLQKNGKRRQCDMVKVDLPPEAIPPGTFCQDAATGKIFVRMPSDAAEPCPIGKHNKVAPKQAIGYYVGRLASGPKEKYFGKLVTAELAAEMEKDGLKEIDAVANVFTGLFGTPGQEMGTPISGMARDADSMGRPCMPGAFPGTGWYNGPGQFDIGAWEHGFWE